MKRNISGEWKQENQFQHEVGSAPTSWLWNPDWKERDGLRIWYQTNIQSDRVNQLFTLLFWIKYLLSTLWQRWEAVTEKKKQKTQSTRSDLDPTSGSEDLFFYQTEKEEKSSIWTWPWSVRKTKTETQRESKLSDGSDSVWNETFSSQTFKR